MKMCERDSGREGAPPSATTKARSASICGGLESTPPQARRRRPAARSQSARAPPQPRAQRRSVHSTITKGGSDTRLEAAGDLTPTFLTTSTKNKSLEVSGSSGALGRRGSCRRPTSQHRKSAAFLDVPDPPSPPPDDEDNLRIRSFSFNSKGTGIINRGDSFRKKRSRSNSLAGTPPPAAQLSPVASPEATSYRVVMLGSPGVGKTALVSQFMTSECINAYDRQKEEPSQQSVFVMLNGEESELKFITDVPDEGEIEKADAFIIMFSVIDKASFQRAESELSKLQRSSQLRSKPAILVGNKVDLVRSRAVSTQDGKYAACSYGAKFIEVSVGINHNVDELLVGILTQIRLKLSNAQLKGDELPSRHWYNNHGVLRASLKARQMFTWIFGKEDSKFKNVENLHIL